jgi:hypothetical protein
MTDNEPIAAVYNHCQAIYKAMSDEAKAETILVEGEDGGPVATGYYLYEGYATALFQQEELAAPYYTRVMRLLKDMGCVEQLRRGGGAAKSKWRLLREPTEELFHAAESRKRPKDGSMEQLKQQGNAFNNRLLAIEDQIQQHLAALQELQTNSRAHASALDKITVQISRLSDAVSHLSALVEPAQ